MLPLEQTAVACGLISTGVLLIVGLLTGIWKYACIHNSTDATAPVYVDICHRASLMYSFAALVLTVLAAHSAWSAQINLIAISLPLIFFALAIASYALHGLLNDTDNQLRQPHQLGQRTVPRGLMLSFMLALIGAEVGGSLVLLAGVIKQLS